MRWRSTQGMTGAGTAHIASPHGSFGRARSTKMLPARQTRSEVLEKPLQVLCRFFRRTFDIERLNERAGLVHKIHD
jgi:hypothetical protein